MIDIVEELDEVPRQNVVVVIRVRWVSPPKTQEHWQRGAKAEEIFYPEEEYKKYCYAQNMWPEKLYNYSH